ncbi:hypothetical protein D3C73_1663870 [compost metagenome]
MVLIEVIRAGLLSAAGSITGLADEVQSKITSASARAASRLSAIFRFGVTAFNSAWV